MVDEFNKEELTCKCGAQVMMVNKKVRKIYCGFCDTLLKDLDEELE